MTVQQPDKDVAPLVYGTPLTRDSWRGITERDFDFILDRGGGDAVEAWIDAVAEAAGVPTEFTSKNRTDPFHRTGLGTWWETMIEDPIAKAWHDDGKDAAAAENAIAARSHCRKILKRVKKRRKAEAEEIQRQEAEYQRQEDERRRAEAQAAEERQLRAAQHLQDLTTATAEAVRVADDMPTIDRQSLKATPRSQWTPW